MTTVRNTATCGSCGAAVDETIDPADGRRPCAQCGSTARIFGVDIDEAVTARSGLGFKHKRPGHKKPVAEGFSRQEVFRCTGAAVERQMRIDRENNRYTEKVSDSETGIAIHHCDEKLSEHTGHGSAKMPKPI
jgi:hypothetical protein